MMNPLDVKKKVLGAVKGYGREGIGEMLKKGYGPPEGKPALAIEIKSTRVAPQGQVEPGMGEMEEMDDEGMPLKEAMHEMSEGEHEMPDGSMMKDSEMMSKGEGESKITPELLEMLLAKLGK
jgi:hypothetical protein